MRLDVDYERHPAFAPFISVGASADSFNDIFELIDTAVAARIDGRDPQGAAVGDARAAVGRLIDEDAGIEPRFKRFLSAAFDRAVDRCTDEEGRRRRWGEGLAQASAEARRCAEAFLEQGYSVFRMPPAAVQQLREVLMPDVERLRRTFVDLPDDIIISQPSNPASLDIVRDFCVQAGIYDALSAYYGQPYNQAGFAIHVSHPKDSWYRQFDDIGLEMPLTAQMHFDLSFEHPKAMLYLNDVGEGQGPFSVVQKSAPWEWFGSEFAFRREVLHGVGQFMMEVHEKTLTGNRSVLRYPEARRTFASLPRSLRQISHPGDHVLDGTELSGHLLKSEKRFVGEAGIMPVFTGSHVLHRGGLVTEGERWALQIVFYPSVAPEPSGPSSPTTEKRPSIIRRVARRLRRIRSRLNS